MTSAALLDLLLFIETTGVQTWLDGGWGVDALLGMQTRTHKDVDLILCVDDVPTLQKELKKRGFDIKEGVPPHSFVLSDGRGSEIDIHSVSFDRKGNGRYRMRNGEYWIYPKEGFKGKGTIHSKSVRCLSPEAQVLCHAHGYVPVEKDFKDMELLQQQFGLALPPQLQRSAALHSSR